MKIRIPTNIMDYINILHLSDLHFGRDVSKGEKKKAVINSRAIFKGLLQKLESLDSYWEPDIIAVSGDIGYSGIKKEYNDAFVFFEKLLKILNLGPDRLIFCAGNHDRFRLEKDQSYLPSTIEDADNQLVDSNLSKNLVPFSDFIKFQKSLNIPPLIFKSEDNYIVGTREILDCKFLILNSAWFAWGGNRDSGKMIIGKSQLTEMLNSSQIISRVKTIPDQIAIALMHHPPEDLDPHEIDAYKGREPPYPLLAECSDLILCGHKHGEKLFAPDKKFAKSWLFKTGAVYQGEDYENNCEILHIDQKALNINRLKIYYTLDKNRWIEEKDKEDPYQFYTGLSRLRIHTRDILKKIHDRIGLKCKVNRNKYLDSIEMYLNNNKIVFILGDATVGKSVLLKDLNKKVGEEYEVFAFNIGYFNHNSLADYLKENNINEDFADILNSVKKKKICIFLDQSERILEDELKKLNVFKDLLVKIQEIDPNQKELKVILTCRTEVFQNVLDEFIHSFKVDVSKISVILIEVFSDEELSQVFDNFPNLKIIFNEAHLKVLLKNPKMLDILTIPNFKIIPQDDRIGIEKIDITETYFMNQFWTQIVRNNEKTIPTSIDPDSRSQLLNDLAIESFKKAEPNKISSQIDLNVQNSLITDNILLRLKDQIFFSHDVYEEWALLDYIRNKSDIKNDFLIPYNNFKRKSRGFQLYSRYLLESENDYESWKRIYIILNNNNNEINPNWIQEFILGVLKSETLLNLLENLKDFLFENGGKRFIQFLKILQLKCKTYEGKIVSFQNLSNYSSKPIYQIWFFVLQFLLPKLQNLSGQVLFESSEIIREWLTKSYPQVFEYHDKIIELYGKLVKEGILNEGIQFNLDYNMNKRLKKNLIYSLIRCKCLKNDDNLTIIDDLKSSSKTEWLLKDVLFEMYCWIPLYYSFPEYTIKILKDYLIQPEERENVIPRPYNYQDFDFSFDHNPYFDKTSFNIMLDKYEGYALNFIHDIVNQATDLWKKIQEPVRYGPDLRRISYTRTPIPQILKVEGKEIEVWGDDLVYKWPIHLGPKIIQSALNALEQWIINKIQQHNENPIAIINKVLANTKSFSVVSVCSRSILHILLQDNNDKITVENLIRSVMPIIEHPIFWILHSIITSEEYFYYQRQSLRFHNIFEILLFYFPDVVIVEKIIAIVKSFSTKIPFIFEEEKSDSTIVLEREESINLIIAATKKENYSPTRTNNFFFMKFKPPEGIINKKQTEYQENFLKIQSFKGTIFNAIKNEGIIKDYSFDEFFELMKEYFNIYDFYSDVKRSVKYFKKLEDFLKTSSKVLQFLDQNDLPEDLQKDFKYIKYIDWFEDIFELITSFFSFLIIYKSDFILKSNLEDRTKRVILNAIYLKTKRSTYSDYTENSMGIQQSAARSIALLYKKYPKDRRLKVALKRISLISNHQVRDIFFTKLKILWEQYPKLVLKLLKKLKTRSIERAIILRPKFLIINKYRDPRIKREYFKNISWIYIKKLYLIRTFHLLKRKLSRKKFKDLNPQEIDVQFYRSALNLLFEINKNKLEKNILSLLSDLFYFSICNDIKYKNEKLDYKKMKSYYGDCRRYFYRDWLKKAIEMINSFLILHKDNNLSIKFLDFILANWIKTEKFFEFFLEELVNPRYLPKLENNIMDIWYLNAKSVLEGLKRGEIINSNIISLIFFKLPLYRTLQIKVLNSESLEKIREIIKLFLKIKLSTPIIWLLNQIQDFELTKSFLGDISEKIKSISYKEDNFKYLRNEISILLNNIWGNYKSKITTEESLYESFKFLVDKMVEWNCPLSSKLQEDIKL